METLLLYSGKVILTSGVMFLYYQLFLKDKTFHHYNRFYLLSVLGVSVLLPLLKVSYFTLEVNNDIYLLINKIQGFNTNNTLSNDFTNFRPAFFAFGLVSLFFLTRFIYGIIRIQRMKSRFKMELFEGIRFYETELPEAPFSFFRNLFWKNSIHLHSDLGRQILKHEMVHIEQKHTWDKILIEMITAVFWFNPFFYLIRKEINLVHEYLADKKAIKNSDTKAFAQMLLASHFSGKQFPATSPFLNSNLKKRLTMLKKSKTKFSYARKIFALPLLFTVTFIYLVNAKNKEIKETNREIERMVSSLKQDTILPKKNQEVNPQKKEVISTETAKTTASTSTETPQIAYGTDGTELYRNHPEMFSGTPEYFDKIQKDIEAKRQEIDPLRQTLLTKETEARKIGEELRKKGEEFRKLAEKRDFDNPKMKMLEKQMDDLSSKMDGIFRSEDFMKNQELLDAKFKDLDKLYSSFDKFYSGKDFTTIVNSDQFKDIIKSSEFAAKNAEIAAAAAEKAAKNAEKMVNSKEFKKQIAEAEKAAKNAEKMLKSAEFQKRINEAQKAGEEAAKIGAAKVLNGNKSNSSDDIKIFLDGKPITKTEMDQFPSDKIEKMEVFKKGFHGKENSEIRITTKK